MAIEKEKLSEDMKELRKSVSPTSNNNQTSEKQSKEINSLKECIKNLEKQINEWSSSYYHLQKEMDQLIMEKHSYGRVSEKYDKSGINLHKDQPSDEDKISRSFKNRLNSPPKSNYESVRNRVSSPPLSSPPKAEPRSNYESARHSPTRNIPARSLANESSNVSSALMWKEQESRSHDSQQFITFPSFQSAQNNSQIISNLEHKLMELQLDYEKLQNEYEKLPENSRNIASMKKKKDMELELSIIETNINSIKTKLRKYTALS
jgi:predicted RNase H-like nuclease (RuvC/YqgF family)